MNHREAVETLASERYLLDEMSELERHAFEEHYFSCDACAEDIRAAQLMRDGLKAAAPADPARSAAKAPLTTRPAAPHVVPIARPWRRAVVLPWAAAAGLALVAGYQSLNAPAAAPQPLLLTLEPVTLHAGTRGAAERRVPMSSSGVVTLAVDVALEPGTREIAYDLRDAGGKELATGTAPASTEGAPLFVLVRDSILTVGGHYVLTVRDAAAADRVFGESRFTTTKP